MTRAFTLLLISLMFIASRSQAQVDSMDSMEFEDVLPADSSVYDESQLQTIALFIGGEDSLSRYVTSQLDVQKQLNYTGKYRFLVTINEDSTVGEVQLIYDTNTLDPYAKSLMVRLLKMTSRQWVPGQRDGHAVRSRRIVVIDINNQ